MVTKREMPLIDVDGLRDELFDLSGLSRRGHFCPNAIGHYDPAGHIANCAKRRAMGEPGCGRCDHAKPTPKPSSSIDVDGIIRRAVDAVLKNPSEKRKKPMSTSMSPEQQHAADFRAAGGEHALGCTEAQYVETAQRDAVGGVIEFSDMGGGGANALSPFPNLQNTRAAAKAGEGAQHRQNFRDAGGEFALGVSEDDYVASCLVTDAGGQL